MQPKFFIEHIEKYQHASVDLLSQNDGVYVYKARFKFNGDKKGGNLKLGFRLPMLEILSVIVPTLKFKRGRMVTQWFAPVVSQSNFYQGTPTLTVVKDGTVNYASVALSDAVNQNEIKFFVDDFNQQEEVCFAFELLNGDHTVNDYSVLIRVDLRCLPIAQTVKEQTAWQDGFYNQIISPNDDAETPLYSTWYNYHQHPNAKDLLDELKIASKLGFKTVIIDDGWQYDDNGTGDYIDCGDWAFSKEKFPDFNSFVDKVHQLGMKILIWLPLPFVGFNTDAYKRFKDKLLYEEADTINAGILDPRYAEVRQHIAWVCANFMKDYNLDGLKLDFIDSFAMKPSTPVSESGELSTPLSQAIITLLEEICAQMKAVNPNCLVEFRQDYVGPAITKYANMLRVADCAFDSITNRIAVNDMKMLNYNLAVHSDMLYWATCEKPENVCRQLINVMFSVPQISLLLKQIPKEHTLVIKNFLDYWSANKQLLLHGDFNVLGTDATYTQAYVTNGDKTIVANYLLQNFTITGDTDIFNAGTQTQFSLLNPNGLNIKYHSFDCLGNLIESGSSTTTAQVVNFASGGRITISI